MSVGKIVSNLGEGIAGEAAEQAVKKQGLFSKMILGNSTHYNGIKDDIIKMGEDETTKTGDILKKVGKGVLDYHTGGDLAGEGWSRAGAVALRNGAMLGGHLALASAPRYFSGGSFTTNNQGERDIAGIPFL